MINKIILIGRVGKDPEVRNLDGGRKVTTFSLAVSEKYKNKKGETVENTEWFNCQAWDKLAEVVGKYVTKGQLLYIEGKVKPETWEKDGAKHYKTVIVVNSIQMLGSKNSDNNFSVKSGSTNEEPDHYQNDGSDDLPF